MTLGKKPAEGHVLAFVEQYVAQRLRSRRLELDLTQIALAAQVGLIFQQVQKYEYGQNRLTAGRLWLFSRALDVPVGYFFEGFKPPHEEGPSK